MGTAIVSTSRRRHDRPRGPRRGRRRRSRGARLVAAMSRIGRKPIPVPTGVTVSIEPELVRVNGPRGELSERIPRDIDGRAGRRASSLVTRPTDRGEHRALHGLTRSLVANMVEGVTDRLQEDARDPGRRLPRRAQGHGPRARARLLAPRPGQGAGGHRVRGARSRRASSSRASPSSMVGEIAAYIRKQRPPEPYKGKGIRYEGEYVARKVGKRA